MALWLSWWMSFWLSGLVLAFLDWFRLSWNSFGFLGFVLAFFLALMSGLKKDGVG